MGLLDKLRVGNVAPPPASGPAVVTGIRGRHTEDSTTFVARLESAGGGAFGVTFDANPPMVLRLGTEVLVRADGRGVVLDIDAMASAPAVSGTEGRVARGAPDPGIDDKTIGGRVLKHLATWPTTRGVIASWDSASFFGIATDSFDIAVTTSDGNVATASRGGVPTYLRWFVHPGADVPIVVDPKDPARAQVHWLALADERAGGRWDDDPPAGSIAAALLSGAASDAAAMAVGGSGPVDLTSSAEATEAIEGVSIEQWALVQAAIVHDRVPPAQYDAYATERYGVAAGRWTAIAAAWDARMRGDWKVGAAFGEAFQSAQRELKGKGKR